MQRNAKAPPTSTIRLNGDGLIPLEVVVDGQAINSWSLDGGDLIVPLGADTHQIEVVTEIVLLTETSDGNDHCSGDTTMELLHDGLAVAFDDDSGPGKCSRLERRLLGERQEDMEGGGG